MPEEGTTQPNPAPAAPAPEAAPAPAPTEAKKEEDKDVKEGKGVAWLSYCGPLVFIPFFAYKKNAYVQAHAKQGLNLFIIDGIWWAICFALSFIKVPTTVWGITVSTTPWWVGLISSIGNIFIAVISIIGFVHAVKGEVKELPLVGKIKIVK